MKPFIPLSVPNLKGDELTYISDAIQREWVSSAGDYVNRFEQGITNYVHAPAATACQSGTAGLHLSLLANHVNESHAVIVPTLTFIAAVNPVFYVGATPIFMDCDDSLCLDLDKVADFCQTQCALEGKKLIHNASQKHVSTMILVHVFGNMPDMKTALELASRYHITLIEDATEALGSFVKDDKNYAGAIGDVGVYSFNGNKIITTGGGGMVVSSNIDTMKYIKYLSTQAKDDELTFLHHEVGYNYRMTNIQAAMGVAQLEQLEDFIQIKKGNFDRYLSNGITLLEFSNKIRPNYWFYSYLTEYRDDCISFLKEQNIQTRPIWNLIHQLKPYRSSLTYKIEKAPFYWQRVVNIPCGSNLTSKEVDIVSDQIHIFEQKWK